MLLHVSLVNGMVSQCHVRCNLEASVKAGVGLFHESQLSSFSLLRMRRREREGRQASHRIMRFLPRRRWPRRWHLQIGQEASRIAVSLEWMAMDCGCDFWRQQQFSCRGEHARCGLSP